jgi:hypothetical protein
VRDNQGRPFATKTYQSLFDELTEHIGVATAFARVPGGETKAGSGKVHADYIVFEVMADNIDRRAPAA